MIKSIFKINYYQKRKKIILFVILFLLIGLFMWGIKDTYAYYNSQSAFSFLGTTIGDFDIGDGDVNLLLYMQDDNEEYNITKSIPLIGYYLNNEKTDCSNKDTLISYNPDTNEVSVETSEKTTCRIYFDQLGESDVRTYILLEDDTGEYAYNDKTYKLNNTVPDVGYEYVSYKCLNEDATTYIDYDAETRTFSYETTERNICYIYFDALSNPDLTLNIFIQETVNSESYMNVMNIPSLNTYKLNETKSYCLDLDGNSLNAEISYVNGDISVEAENAGVCNVYLDISN